jgi:nucleoside-diphosphate-sugar epimerase
VTTIPLDSARVLVTGASGFIGTHLCRRLGLAGADVQAVSRTERIGSAAARWHRCDLTDPGAVQALVAAVRPQVIYHLASYVSGAREVSLVLPTFRANLETTVNLLVAATDLGCERVIIAGSLEEPELGGMDPTPCSPYAAAKWAAGAYARMFHALYGTPACVARLFMVYGPGQRDQRKLIPYVTLSLLRREAPKLMSGSRLVDWIYVDDVIEGLLAMSEAPGIAGSTVDLGTGIATPVRRVVEQLVAIVGSGAEPVFGAVRDRPLERVRVADTAGVLQKLRWRPTTPLEVGLRRTVEWYARELSVQSC